jgi:copper oxidase (laccase) domain-containing protein
MMFRKDILSIYSKHVLTQRDWNDTFRQLLSQIGKMHANQAGSTSIYLDYIHINALLLMFYGIQKILISPNNCFENDTKWFSHNALFNSMERRFNVK